MPISDIMQKNVITISSDASIQEAAKFMKEKQIGTIVVVKHEQDKTPCGILTDRDIAVKMVAADIDLNQLKVADAMSENLLLVKQNQGVREVIEALTQKGVRRAPVVDEQNQAVGIISVDDLIRLLANEFKSLSNLIHQQIEEAA